MEKMPEQLDNTEVKAVSDADKARTPIGYCPHCDYRIDPGICPECGETVEQHQLRPKPRAVRRRMWIRRTALLAIVVGLVIGGRWFYRSNIWRKCVPTSYLLAQEPSQGWTHDELIDRLNNGKLSAKETGDFFDASFPIKLIVRSPHPKAVAPTITLNTPDARCAINTSLRAIRQVCYARLSIDGRLIDQYAFGQTKSDLLAGGGGSTSQVLTDPKLDVGEHTIEVTGQVIYDLQARRGAASLPGFPITRTYSLSKTLEIVDRPVSAFVDAQYDETLAHRVAGSIRLVLSKQAGFRGLSIHVQNGHAPITIAGMLRISNSKTGEQIGTTSLTIPKASTTDGFGMMIRVDKSMSFDHVKCNVEFVPDPEKAFISGDMTYFGGRMTWRNLQVVVKKRSRYGYQPYDSDIQTPKYTRPPDSVTRWNPDNTDSSGADNTSP